MSEPEYEELDETAKRLRDATRDLTADAKKMRETFTAPAQFDPLPEQQFGFLQRLIRRLRRKR